MASVQLPNDMFSPTQNQRFDADFESFLKFDPASPESSKTIQQLSPPASFVPTDFDDNFYSHDNLEENVAFSGPSHNYNMHKQHTSLPTGGLVGLHNLNQPLYPRQSFVSSMRGSADFDFTSFAGGSSSWNTGIPDNDSTFPLAGGTPSFPSIPSGSSIGGSLMPTPIDGQQEAPDGRPARIYPGMHQEQAAAKKKQQLLLQQQQQQQQQQARQQAMLFMMQQQGQVQSQNQLRPPTGSDLERDIISGVINQKRHSTAASSADDDSFMDNHDGSLPHYPRMKKDEEDMDEDERLLASEEGKKLSSKERRQLRNKVSARAFRSRRKEYISQLEGEVAVKSAEIDELKRSNRKLTSDNQSLLHCIQTLVGHPGFADMMPDISKLLAATGPPAQSPPDNGKSNSAQKPQPSSQRSMPANPQTCPDMERLNLQNESWLSSGYPFTSNQPQVFSILEIPQGPAVDQFDFTNIGEKDSDFPFAPCEHPDSDKADMPWMESITRTPCADSFAVAPCIESLPDAEVESGFGGPVPDPLLSDADKSDPCMALYIDENLSKPVESIRRSTVVEPHARVSKPGNVAREKPIVRLELMAHDDVQVAHSEIAFRRRCARILAAMERISPLTAHLNT